LTDCRGLEVDTKDLSLGYDSITRCIEVLRGSSRNLTSVIRSELDSCWSGPAKETFTGRYSIVLSELEAIIKAHEELNTTLRDAEKDYLAVEAKAVSLVRASMSQEG